MASSGVLKAGVARYIGQGNRQGTGHSTPNGGRAMPVATEQNGHQEGQVMC